MGYSCTQDADNMLGLIRHTFSNGKYSNGLVIRGKSYFYEVGKEHGDGHITGTLFENISETHAKAVGHFSILENGQISRFPRIKQNQMVSLKFQFDELKRTNPSLLRSYSCGVI